MDSVPVVAMGTVTSQTVRMAVEAIRERIRKGEIEAGGYLPSETQLASSLDISRGTVRRAIEILTQDGDIVRQPFCRPIIATPPTLAPSDGTDIHVWISRPIADGASLQFLRGISTGLQGTKYRMIVREPVRFYGDHVKSEEREFLNNLLDDRAAVGTILERDAFADNADLMSSLIERGKHLVFVDIPPPKGIAADHVGTANLAAARRCVGHLLDLGHHQVACITDTRHPQPMQDRIRGYWRMMAQSGNEEHGRLIVADETAPYDGPPMPRGGVLARTLSKANIYSEWAQRAVRDLLALEPRPTALFVTCDVLAYWIQSSLQGLGLSVPGDFAIVGFDWLARWNEPACDVLTTASQDFEGFGAHAADLIVERASGQMDGSPKHVLLEAPLIVRESTVPCHESEATSRFRS